MQNLMNDPIHRNAERRRNESRTRREQEQRKRAEMAEMIAAIKILLLWMFCFVAVTVFIVAIETVLPYRFVLKWILIFTFTCVLIRQIDEVAQKIKRGGRIERENSRNCARHKNS